jgi:hypothetical protein
VALGKYPLTVRKAVQAAVTARNDARDAWMLASVAQTVAWDALREHLESFERQVAAHFDKDRKGYQQVFASTVPALLRTPPSGREDALKDVIAYAGKSGHSGKVASTGKELAAAWAHYQVEARAEKEATARLDQAVDAVLEAKRNGLVAMRETDGKLRSHFAAEPALAKRFFRSKPARAASRKATKEVDEPPTKPAVKESPAVETTSPE